MIDWATTFEVVPFARPAVKAARSPMPQLAGEPIPGLTDFQDRVFRMKLMGLSNPKVARIMGTSEAGVTQALRKAKRKMKGGE